MNKLHLIKKSRGLVLLLVTMLLPSLILLVSFVIDIHALSNAKEAAQGYTRLAALAAIEGYFSLSECPESPGSVCSVEQKREAASDRANKLAVPNSLMLQSDSQTYSSASRTSVTETPGKIRVELGNWKEAATDNTVITCSTAEGTKSAPCFEPWDGNSPSVNAVRASGTYLPAARSFFIKYVRTGGLNISTYSIVGLVPRRGVFIVDISGSIASDTHSTSTPISPQPSPYPNPSLKYQVSYLTSANNPGLTTTIDDAAMNWLNNPASGKQSRSGSLSTTTHFADDYKKIYALNDDDYTGYFSGVNLLHPSPTARGGRYSHSTLSSGGMSGSTRLLYEVDSYRSGQYTGPQPLTDILAGVKDAVFQFKNRHVAGDMLSIVVVDDKLTWPRVVEMTNNFTYLEKFLDLSNSSSILNETTAPTAITDSSGGTGLLRSFRHGLIPRRLATGRQFSDLLLGVNEAMFQLGKSQAIDAANFITIFSDFMPNCYYNGFEGLSGTALAIPTAVQNWVGCDLGWGGGDPTGFHDGAGTGISDTGRYPRCSDDYMHYLASSRNLLNYARRVAAPNNIVIHSVIVGASVRPYSIDHGSSKGLCYTDAELRRLGDPNKTIVRRMMTSNGKRLEPPSDCGVRGNTVDKQRYIDFLGWSTNYTDLKNQYASRSSASPFTHPNWDSYVLAASTGGLWIPLRPPATGCTVTSPTEARSCAANTEQEIYQDPYCRTQAKQITDFIDTLMSQNPYRVLQVTQN